MFQNIENKSDVNGDLKEEALITLEILKKLSKPNPPDVEGKKVIYRTSEINHLVCVKYCERHFFKYIRKFKGTHLSIRIILAIILHRSK